MCDGSPTPNNNMLDFLQRELTASDSGYTRTEGIITLAPQTLKEPLNNCTLTVMPLSQIGPHCANTNQGVMMSTSWLKEGYKSAGSRQDSLFLKSLFCLVSTQSRSVPSVS